MNRDTQRIMTLLGLSAEEAFRVQQKMGADGLDFSGCTARQFVLAARAAAQALGLGVK